MNTKLKLDAKFEPQAVGSGDEIFPNGMFEFNIPRLGEYVKARPLEFPVMSMAVADIPIVC